VSGAESVASDAVRVGCCIGTALAPGDGAEGDLVQKCVREVALEGAPVGFDLPDVMTERDDLVALCD
jgi:hypothetical protein